MDSNKTREDWVIFLPKGWKLNKVSLLVSISTIMFLCKKLRLWKDIFKLWTLLQEDICHYDAWSKLAKKWGMCSMTWFSQVSMSQWGLPKDVTVIGIWWLGHFPSSHPPLPPRLPSSPSPLPPKSIWPGQPTKLAKTCSLKQGPRDLAHHPSPFPRSMKRNLSLEKFTPDSTSNCLSSHTYSGEANWENCCGMFCFCKWESVQTVLILRCSNCWLGKVSETVEFTQEQVGGQTLKTNNSSCKSSNTLI